MRVVTFVAVLAGCADGKSVTGTADDAGPAGHARATPSALAPEDAGSGQSPNDANAAVGDEKLCDGSDHIRIVFSLAAGGAVNPNHFSTNPYGYSFAAVDGRCRFYASRAFKDGIVVGTLAAADAEHFAADVRFSTLGQWSGRYGRSCPDAGGYLVATADADVSCTCGCDGAPDAAEAAMSGASKWHEQLIQSGKLHDDELPEAVADALKTFIDAAWKRNTRRPKP
jgi:hypothetical protein